MQREKQLWKQKSYMCIIRQLLVYINEGYEWIVDIDLEKFFDNVPQGGIAWTFS